ncbi:MAG: hypothetical protein U9N76_08450 [Candidatus Marinimicrobia bacterium]|nr:hypothetical protein [Candidatus Neomarinimicrobiota bacterium]
MKKIVIIVFLIVFSATMFLVAEDNQLQQKKDVSITTEQVSPLLAQTIKSGGKKSHTIVAKKSACERENDKLKADVSRLQNENAQLQKQNASLKKGSYKVKQLKDENAKLRRAINQANMILIEAK